MVVKKILKLCNLDKLLSHLSESRRCELADLVQEFPCLFGDAPSRTDWVEHDIEVGDAHPIKSFYRMSPEKLKRLDFEVSYMVENNMAVPSDSSWASPCILVPKQDKTPWFCTDMRKVNCHSQILSLCREWTTIDSVGPAKFVSKFNLLKGYWQVPLSKRAQEIGIYYTVGSVFLYGNAIWFKKRSRYVPAVNEPSSVYLDDLVIFSDTWHSRLQRIQALFEHLAEVRLTVNLAKCEFAKATVTYLGRVVGQGCVTPFQAKVMAVERFPLPTTKKELQRFLGLVGYYRGFC